MRPVRFAVVLTLAAVLQASVVDIFSLTAMNIKPDLLLILMVFSAVFFPMDHAIIAAFCTGFAADLISAGPMGAMTISFGLIGSALAFLHQIIAVRQMFLQAVVIGICGFLTYIIGHVLTLLRTGTNGADFISSIVLGSLYSAAIGPFVFLPISWALGIKTGRFKY